MTYNVLKKPDVFYIGKQDEGKAETIDIDYSAWIERYGNGVITATFQGAEDAAPYDIVLTTANGIATWTVTKANTVAAGVGKLQLNYIVNDVEAKSLIWTVRVYPSMRASGEAPDGYQDWLTALQGLSAETQQNAQNAANSATEAEEYAEQAKASADSITGLTVEAETLPAGSSATASFDADTDKLSLGIPRGDKGEKGDAGQDGITPDLTIGTTETLPAGSSATATITGTKENPVLNLGIPQGTQGIQGERGGKGDTGATPDISIGTIETLNPDESATATITGTAEDPVLNLGIPKGDTGSAGADGFSPSANVTKQDGNIVITITDKDGTTSETLEVDNALDEDSVNPVQNAAIVEAMRSMLPVDMASGAIASFPDGADDVPILSLKAQIEPVQDLHGYENPWPAGGGKNKFLTDFASPQTVNGVTLTKNDDGTVTANGTLTSAFDYVIGHMALKAGSYILNGCPSDGGSGKYRLQVTDYPVVNNLGQDNGSGVSFTLSEDMEVAVRIQMYTSPSNLVFKPMIRLSSVTDGTYAPYSNECPITGHTGVKVEKSGKNLLPMKLYDGGSYNPPVGAVWTLTESASQFANPSEGVYEWTPTASWQQRVLLAEVDKSLSYHLKLKYSSTGTAGRTIGYLDENYTVLTKDNTTDATSTFNSNLVIPSGAKYLYIVLTNRSNASVVITVTEPQLEIGSTATDYEPYQGEIISQEFVDAQGNQLTVYGGESEIVGGKMTSRMAMVTLPTSTSRWYSGYGGYYYQDSAINGTDANRGEAKCNMFPTVASRSERGMYVGSGTIYFSLVQDIYPTLSDWMAFINDVNVQCVLPLATPIEYTLTAQEVKTYLGQNNIWSDTGDTEVMYKADIQKFIEKKVNA